jgi:hypothetical protein
MGGEVKVRVLNADPHSAIKYINKKLLDIHHYCRKNRVDFLQYLGYIQNVLEVAKNKGFIETWMLPEDPNTNPVIYKAMTKQELPIEIKIPAWQ